MTHFHSILPHCGEFDASNWHRLPTQTQKLIRGRLAWELSFVKNLHIYTKSPYGLNVDDFKELKQFFTIWLRKSYSPEEQHLSGRVAVLHRWGWQEPAVAPPRGPLDKRPKKGCLHTNIQWFQLLRATQREHEQYNLSTDATISSSKTFLTAEKCL